jgi:hypothetical protein
MQIWYSNLRSFFNIDNVFDFIPSSSMNLVERLNVLTRLSLYISILLYLLTNDYRMFGLFVVTGSITGVIYGIDNNKEKYVDEYFEDDIDSKTKRKHKLSISRKKCTNPTKENPFMNVLVNEYNDNPERDPACDVSDVKKYVDEYFQDDLYRSVDDVYNKNSSIRQYYTTANTSIPNDQEAFAKWLYPLPDKTCKEGNGEKCKYFSSSN